MESAKQETGRKRLFEGTQALIAPLGYLAGLNTLGECMGDEDVRAFLGHAILDEILPCAPLEKGEGAAYAAAVCRQYETPLAGEPLLPLTARLVEKWRAFVLPSLADYAAREGCAPRCLSLGLAALVMFYAAGRLSSEGRFVGLRGEGEEYALEDAPEVCAAFDRLSCDMPPESLAYAVLSDQELWDRDLREIPEMEERLGDALRDLQLIGLRAAMNRAWAAPA